jgi:hypothetical protein
VENPPHKDKLYALNQTGTTHPEYVLENRQKQRLRNARKAKETSTETKIVNPDAIYLHRGTGYLWPKIAHMHPIMIRTEQIRDVRRLKLGWKRCNR